MTRSAIEQRRLRNVEKGRLWRAKKKAERREHAPSESAASSAAS
jgi:hypothetical protein